MTVRPIVDLPESPIEVSASLNNGSAAWNRFRDLVAERSRWIWLAVIHRNSLVGGVILHEELGRTTRGTIARGRHLLLGRNVTIRLLPGNWGEPDVVGLAKAHREAYVAGEIVHPNLIHRVNLGEDRSRRYVIEEAIEIPTLGGPASWPEGIGEDQALPIILHTARALLAAHDQGLTHGDPSLENLGIDDGGIIKLTGLGLNAPVTEVQNPSQSFALFAAADAQKLGYTLESIVIRRPNGESCTSGLAQTVAAKLKSVGTPEGYRDLGEAVRAIETILGVTAGGLFLPKNEETKRLEAAVEQYHESPLASLRIKLILGFVGICSVFFLLFIKVGNLDSRVD